MVLGRLVTYKLASLMVSELGRAYDTCGGKASRHTIKSGVINLNLSLTHTRGYLIKYDLCFGDGKYLTSLWLVDTSLWISSAFPTIKRDCQSFASSLIYEKKK